MAEVKNIRIATSGVYQYAYQELPCLQLALPEHGAPSWVETKQVYNVYRPAIVFEVAKDMFRSLPLTHHHPKTPVNDINFRELAVGYTGDTVFIDHLENKNEVGIRSTAVLYDAEALDAYNRGEVQLSAGYTAEFEWQNGTTPSGEPYDVIMKKITSVNHVALLPSGRGGVDAVVMDGAFNYSNNTKDGAPKGNDNASKDHVPAEDDDLGEDFSNYKGLGQSAIYHLMDMKRGQVKGAFHRYDIGDIDICWGEVTDPKAHKGYGLAHILDKHGEKALNMVAEIIEKGYPNKNWTKTDRITMRYKNYNLILTKTWKDKKRIVLITGFDKLEGKNTAVASVDHYMTETSSTSPKEVKPLALQGYYGKNRRQLAKTSNTDNIKDNSINCKSIFEIIQNGSIFDRVKAGI